MKKTIVSFSVLSLLLAGCATGEQGETTSTSSIAYNQASTSHYDVVKRDQSATIDGSMNEDVWKDIGSISGSFHYPWESTEAPLTIFKAYHDNDNFYFGFDVTDPDVLLEEKANDESIVDVEDRVELFFASGSVDKPTTEGMQPYYGIEIDAKGYVHDYSIIYYRDFDSDWTLDGLETKAQITDTGYIVEGLIPMKTLNDLKLINNNIMRTGVYRAEFSSPESESEDIIMQWISWVDPKTEAPDFHVDSSFGEFRFLE